MRNLTPPKSLDCPEARKEWRRVVQNIGDHARWLPASTAILEAYCRQVVRVRQIEQALTATKFDTDPHGDYGNAVKMLNLQQTAMARMAMRIGIGTAGTSAAVGGRKGMAKPNAVKPGAPTQSRPRPVLRAVGTRGKA